MIKVGGNSIGNIMKGANGVRSAYRGSNLLWTKHDLPSGYTRLKFLQAITQNPYIDTGVRADSNMGIHIRCYEVRGRFGSHNNAVVPVARHHSYEGNPAYGFGARGYGSSYKTPIEYEMKVNYFNDKKFVFNGNQQQMDSTEFDTGDNYGLFKRLGLLQTLWYGKVYYAKLTYGNELVRSFIPALDNDNVPCLYDLVTKQPFYNVGSGNFTYEIE